MGSAYFRFRSLACLVLAFAAAFDAFVASAFRSSAVIRAYRFLAPRFPMSEK